MCDNYEVMPACGWYYFQKTETVLWNLESDLRLWSVIFLKNRNHNCQIWKMIYTCGQYFFWKTETVIVWSGNRDPSHKSPQYIRQISNNARFCNRNVHMCAHFSYKMVHCGILGWCNVGFVQQVYLIKSVTVNTDSPAWSITGSFHIFHIHCQAICGTDADQLGTNLRIIWMKKQNKTKFHSWKSFKNTVYK